jgi:hypothetical protein
MKPVYKTLLWLTAFSIAMGYLEASVVVYLRQLLYPQGFTFPLVPMAANLAAVEFWREAATVIMLVGIAVVAAKNNWVRFAWFLYCFAVWDIFYYVFLKIALDWPASLFTWDILFLIPVPWLGPVLAPCLVALTMILLALILVLYYEKGYRVNISKKEGVLMLLGCGVILISFMWDYVTYVLDGGPTSVLWSLNSKTNLFQNISQYVPVYYNWWLFIAGEALLMVGIWILVKRLQKQNIRLENREWLQWFVTNAAKTQNT